MTEETTGRVVVVRIDRFVFTSPVLPDRDAETLRDSLRAQIRMLGDSPGMIEFTDWHGREVDIRARAVKVVELGAAPDGTRRAAQRLARGGFVGPAPVPAPPLGDGHGVHLADVSLTIQEDRRGVEGSIARHPAGRSR